MWLGQACNSGDTLKGVKYPAKAVKYPAKAGEAVHAVLPE